VSRLGASDFIPLVYRIDLLVTNFAEWINSWLFSKEEEEATGMIFFFSILSGLSGKEKIYGFFKIRSNN